MAKVRDVIKKHGVEVLFNDSVGDGWSDILDRLFTDLIEMGWAKRGFQIKEKFASLTFYADYSGISDIDTARKRVDAARAESSKTCELCGEPGFPMRGSMGWWKTLCEDHHAEREAIYASSRDVV